MIGLSDPTTPDFVQTLSKSKVLLSKFTAPFTSRKRNLAQYYVEPDEPHRRYSPGDTVKGAVILTVAKPIRITHLVVCLHGFVKVFTSAKLPGEDSSREERLLSGGTGKRGCQYFGNGFASLFENEVTLCGEGRLEAGSFVFQFILELPSKGLPSSISFERGTISYMLTSTLTRPTTIAPIAKCERKIQLVEAVDIAAYPRPKPRVVSMETLSRRSMTIMSARKTIKSSGNGKGQTQLSSGLQSSANSFSSPNPHNAHEPPRSPVPSTRSFASAPSSSFSTHQVGSPRPLAKSNGELADHTATATVELLRRGYLPGDKLAVQISIVHNKPIKNLQGIIITMYREGQVDTHPALPLGLSQSKSKQQYEDYYPKSRTGLGGLSLSSAGSSSGFRKDLAQKFVPLIVNPQSLTFFTKTSIQVPDDLFPTVSTVPGAMITFKYFIEVVIDLRWRITGQDRFLPRLNMTTGTSTYGYGDYKSSGIERSGRFGFSPTPGLDILITEQIRREKGVVACLFEVIVGTHDSGRKRGRQTNGSRAFDTSHGEMQNGSDDDKTTEGFAVSIVQERDGGFPQDVDYQTNLQTYSDIHYTETESEYWQTSTVPPPIVEEDVDEKSRIRRAEQRLLPSSPITYDERLSSEMQAQQPSAPEVFNDGDFTPINVRANQCLVEFDGAAPRLLATPATKYENDHYQTSLECNAAVYSSIGSQADKQELERRRLQLAASSPDGFQDGVVAENGSQPPQFVEPTAPILNDVFPYQHHDRHEPCATPRLDDSRRLRESLPLYQK